MKYLVGYLIGIQIIAFLLFFIDKQKAIRNRWRIPEKTLFLSAILGGSIGAILGMKLCRHKTKHLTFKIGLPLILIIQLVLIISMVWSVNALVINSTAESVVEVNEVDSTNEYILVLGASVYSDGTPSSMLEDRLNTAVSIYQENPTMRIIVSGYYDDKYYDEVGSMKNYLIAQGVQDGDIIEDYFGYSTYDSISNLKNSYDIDSVVIVTQQYHMYRAIYVAMQLGLDVQGVNCKDVIYNGQLQREVREVLARCKDVLVTTIDLNIHLKNLYF